MINIFARYTYTYKFLLDKVCFMLNIHSEQLCVEFYKNKDDNIHKSEALKR